MSSLGDFDTIKLEQEGAVAVLTLHRPEKMNAFTGKMMKEMIFCLTSISMKEFTRGLPNGI